MSSRRLLLPLFVLSLACMLTPSAALACCFDVVESTPLNPEFSAFFHDAYDGWVYLFHLAMTVVLVIYAVVFSRKRRAILDDTAYEPDAEHTERAWKTLWGAFLLRNGACLSAVTFYTLALRTVDICHGRTAPNFEDAIGAMLFFGAIHVCALVANAVRYKKIPCLGLLPIGYGGWGVAMALLWILCRLLREETTQHVLGHVTF